ncbi:MAG: TVP38/TMEM64 family protein [Leptolyngbya foveolarum]|uniref:TVP38/TMEM64 family membrane protein n=1 Tax=Leptolyngbya foveolarum TaxID=47253 RepID=A0A2W4UJJ5_9CYAN|nr:MAG: TVP38/TMEM64 family protein [Leptolyngbya foveolarum]
MKTTQKFGLLFLSAIALTLLISSQTRQSLAPLLDPQTLTGVFAHTDTAFPIRSVSLFLAAHIIANAIGIPGTVFVVVGGAVYGLWWGTLWSVIGATLGAIAAFWLARYFLHNWFSARFKHNVYIQKISHTLCKKGLSCVLTIRFSPVSPFNLVNFALGLTPVSVRNYALGTLIGIIPGTLIYTWLGVTGAEALSGGQLLPLFCCLGVLALISAVPLIISRSQFSS